MANREPGRKRPELEVTVILTECSSGLRREWLARPAESEVPRWAALIEQCPWGENDAGQSDRFVWCIEAQSAETRHQECVPEARLLGAWLVLVHEVQAFAAQQKKR